VKQYDDGFTMVEYLAYKGQSCGKAVQLLLQQQQQQ
jgi:hypothetical protein